MTIKVYFKDDFTGAAANANGRNPQVSENPWTATAVSLQGDGTVLCTDTVGVPRQGNMQSITTPGNLQAPGYMEMVFTWGTGAPGVQQELSMTCDFWDGGFATLVQISAVLQYGPGYKSARLAVGTHYVNIDSLPYAVDPGDNTLRCEWDASGKLTFKLNGTLIDDTLSFASLVSPGLTWFEVDPRINWGDDRTPITTRYRVSSFELGMTPTVIYDGVFLLDEFEGPAAPLGLHMPDIINGGVAWLGDAGYYFRLLGNGTIRHDYTGSFAADNFLRPFPFPTVTPDSIIVWEMDFIMGEAQAAKQPRLSSEVNFSGDSGIGLTIGIQVTLDFSPAGTAVVRVYAYMSGVQHAQTYAINLDMYTHRVRIEADLATFKMTTYIDFIPQPDLCDIEPGDPSGTTLQGEIHVSTMAEAPTSAARHRMTRLMGALKAVGAPPYEPFWTNYVNCIEYAGV